MENFQAEAIQKKKALIYSKIEMGTLLIIIVIVVFFIYFCFNYYSATKGMIRSNLSAFKKAKKEGMSSDDAMHFMILTRYRSFPQKRGEFIPLYALFLSYLENPEISNTDFPDAFGILGIIFSSFHLHHKFPENIGEVGKGELEMLRRVIPLMHIYESGAIFQSPRSAGFPTVKFLDSFIFNIDKEYRKNLTAFMNKDNS